MFKVSLLTTLITIFQPFPAVANQQFKQTEELKHIPLVHQLSNLEHNHWVNATLNVLINKYQCPNHHQSTMPNENQWAQTFHQCLNHINQSQQTIPLEDQLSIEKLQQNLISKFNPLSTTINDLENHSATLSKQQFSTTTKFEGEVIFGIAGVISNNRVDNSQPIDTNLTLSNRTRLEFETSFNGSDELRIRFQSRNIPEFEDFTGTSMANLGFDGNTDGNIELSRLDYETNLSPNTEIAFNVVGGGLGDYIDNINSLFSDSGDGAISLFARENPIRRQGGAPGIGLKHQVTDNISLQLGYVATDADDPDIGIFQSPYATALQAIFQPSDYARFSFTYLRSFNGLNTGTSSVLAGNPFNGDSKAIMANSLGIEASLDLSSRWNLGARLGYIQAQAQDLEQNPEAELLTWAILLGIKDLGKEGNVLGFVLGQPLRIIDNDYGTVENTGSWHLEAFYRLKINDHIAITPGVFVLLNPENNDRNSPIYVPVIRTTLSF